MPKFQHGEGRADHVHPAHRPQRGEQVGERGARDDVVEVFGRPLDAVEPRTKLVPDPSTYGVDLPGARAATKTSSSGWRTGVLF